MKDREELAKYAAIRGCHDTAEVGVYNGAYSEIICRHIPNVNHICVDTWAPSRNHRNQKRLDEAYNEAVRRMMPYKATFYIADSVAASRLIPDDSLDFIYIDAAHDYKSVTKDLASWYPKLRTGGIMSGHDYGTERHQLRCVKAAVDDYAKSVGIESIGLTGEEIASWYWIKK